MQIIILQGSHLILITLTPTGDFRVERYSLIELVGVFADRAAALRAGQDALDSASGQEGN